MGDSHRDRYAIIEVLGEGGFATVYLAEDRVLKQRVAIKVLHLGQTDERTHQRFIFEAQTAANLRHSGIVNVFDIVQTADGLQQVMEYYPGGTLRDRVELGGAIPPKQALQITLKMLEALSFAHRKGIIHRDIKPANIFFAEDGAVKIGDFGLCASYENHEHTMTGESMGTPLYMAPEQMKDAKDIDQRGDVYSTGLTLYFMLTGERPNIVDLSMIPASLRPIISRATAQLRDRRLESCEAFKAMIDEVLPLVGEGPAAAPSKPEDIRPEDIFESALLNVGGRSGSGLSESTRETSSIAQAGRSLSIAAVTAVLSTFLTLGIVGGYLTLTSRNSPSSQTTSLSSASPAPLAAAENGPGFEPDIGAQANLVPDAPNSPGMGEFPTQQEFPTDPPDSTMLLRNSQTAYQPVGDGNTLDGIPQIQGSGPYRSGGIPEGQAYPEGGIRTPFSGNEMNDPRNPRPRPGMPGAGPQGMRRPRPGEQEEMLDLPFHLPVRAMLPIGDTIRNLVYWIDVEDRDPNSQSITVVREMLSNGNRVDPRNPIYPFLLGRIAEAEDDKASAGALYAEARRRSPTFMESPGEYMRRIVQQGGIEVTSDAAQSFVFAAPNPTAP
jgi:serine/threonine protein kinase